MGLLECICGYGVAPTADDRIAKAMQTFNLKARAVSRRSHFIDATRGHRTRMTFGLVLSLEGVAARHETHTPPAGKRYKSPVAHVQEA